jgi:hypothetical protein
MNISALNQKLDNVLHRLTSVEEKLGSIEHLVTDSPDTKKDKNPPPPSQQKPRNISGPLITAWRIAQGAILGFLALYGGVGTFVSLRYDVSVLPYSTTNSKDANETRFLVTNQGPFAIHQVFYACKFAPPQSGGEFHAMATLVPSPIDVRSHGNFSAYCQRPTDLNPVEGTLLDFEVMYTLNIPFLSSKRGGELFLLKYDSAGDAVWLPVMDMTPAADDLKKLACPKCD